jgi:hypothetical protein
LVLEISRLRHGRHLNRHARCPEDSPISKPNYGKGSARERQEAQLRLLESERRYRRLIEAVVDYAIFQLDVNGIVVTWNVGANASKATQPTKSSPNISANSIQRKTAQQECRHRPWTRPGPRDATRPKAVACERTAHTFGRWSCRCDLRRRQEADRVCQGHARHYRTVRGAAHPEADPGTSCRA